MKVKNTSNIPIKVKRSLIKFSSIFKISWLTNASSAIDGIFPKKVAIVKLKIFILLTDAAKVTNPDGINGISLVSKTSINAPLPLLLIILSTNLYFPSSESTFFLNPNL